MWGDSLLSLLPLWTVCQSLAQLTCVCLTDSQPNPLGFWRRQLVFLCTSHFACLDGTWLMVASVDEGTISVYAGFHLGCTLWAPCKRELTQTSTDRQQQGTHGPNESWVCVCWIGDFWKTDFPRKEPCKLWGKSEANGWTWRLWLHLAALVLCIGRSVRIKQKNTIAKRLF